MRPLVRYSCQAGDAHAALCSVASTERAASTNITGSCTLGSLLLISGTALYNRLVVRLLERGWPDDIARWAGGLVYKWPLDQGQTPRRSDTVGAFAVWPSEGISSVSNPFCCTPNRSTGWATTKDASATQMAPPSSVCWRHSTCLGERSRGRTSQHSNSIHTCLHEDISRGQRLVWHSPTFYLPRRSLLTCLRKTYLIPENLYDPSLLLSPYVFSLGILFRHNAFGLRASPLLHS